MRQTRKAVTRDVPRKSSLNEYSYAKNKVPCGNFDHIYFWVSFDHLKIFLQFCNF